MWQTNTHSNRVFRRSANTVWCRMRKLQGYFSLKIVESYDKYVIPIEKIIFLKDSNSLEITYYKGSEKELTTEILNFS